MTTAEEARSALAQIKYLGPIGSYVRSITALEYAIGMLNEIRLYALTSRGPDDMEFPFTDIHSIAEVALEGIKKRLTGEEK